MAIVKLTLKLAGMRKAQEFVVYPRDAVYTEIIKIQSKSVIGRFDSSTGKGWLNWRGSNAKYGVHLDPSLGAEPFTLPRDVLLMCQEMRPNSGDHIGAGVYVA